MADKKTIKIFISQPMRNKTREEILLEREKLKIAIKRDIFPNENIELINSVLDENDAKNKPLWCLGKSIQLLSEADVVIFTEDYAKARGCRVERICAGYYGIKAYITFYNKDGKLRGVKYD